MFPIECCFQPSDSYLSTPLHCTNARCAADADADATSPVFMSLLLLLFLLLFMFWNYLTPLHDYMIMY